MSLEYYSWTSVSPKRWCSKPNWISLAAWAAVMLGLPRDLMRASASVGSLDPRPIRLQLNARSPTFFNFVLLKKNRPGTEEDFFQWRIQTNQLAARFFRITPTSGHTWLGKIPYSARGSPIIELATVWVASTPAPWIGAFLSSLESRLPYG